MSSNVTRQLRERPEPQPAQRRRGDGWVVARFALWAVALAALVFLMLPGALLAPGTDTGSILTRLAIFGPLIGVAVWRFLAALADLTGATSTPRRPGSCP